MEEAIRTRLRLLVENVEVLIKSSQDVLKKITVGSNDTNEAQIISAKLKSAIDRFISEIYNHYRLVQNPSADEMYNYTAIQIRAEELVIELNLKIKERNQVNKEANLEPFHIPNVSSRLPKMELARFDGNVLKWHEFWDQFVSNVDNRNISDVDKLLYLQSVLEGEAKRALEGLDTTNKNYQIAVSTLKERYGKPSAIVDAHYAALYNIKSADKSVFDCRRVFNEIERHLRVLKSLGEDVNHNHLRVMIMQKFSEDLIYELRMKINSDTFSIEDIRRHIECIISAREASNRMKREIFPKIPDNFNQNNERCSLETLHVASVEGQQIPQVTWKRNYQSNSNVQQKYRGKEYERKYNNTNNTRKRRHSVEKRFENKETRGKMKKLACIFCGNGHYNDTCTEVKSILDRKRKLEGRCFNCLAKGHRSSECQSHKKCYHCGKYGDHNRALCPSKNPMKTNISHVNDYSVGNGGFTVLQTAIVTVNSHGSKLNSQICRVLFDSGSQRTYITKNLSEKLNLTKLETNTLSVFTFGADRPKEILSPVVKFDIKTKINKHITIHANVVPHITNRVPTLPSFLKGRFIDEINMDRMILADDSSMGDQIDILIGNDYYFSVMTGDKILVKENLYLVNSDFGWVWSGKFTPLKENTDKLAVLTYFQSCIELSGLNEPDLPLKNDDMRKLWDLESIGITDSPKASRDDEAIQQFNQSTQYYEKRYHVKWPWIEFPPVLPTNFGLAHGRLISLLKRIDPKIIQSYDKILRDQLEQNIIEIILDTMDPKHTVHYLPHNCIAREDKLRLVYDASAKTKGNKSLNECLYRGPLLLEDLTGLLIRFREHRIAVVADVEKAFLQVGLQEEDRDVTRFLWLKDIEKSPSSDNLLHLRFRRVPFGVISSPFLLNATIRYHLKKANNQVYDQIAKDLYVDNLVTGSDSIFDAISLCQTARDAFNDLSMNLREWNSNSAQVRESIPSQYRSKLTNSMKVLGLNWNLNCDSLALRFESAQKFEEHPNTKREVLRLIASVFDPCGFAVPLILSAKLFLQDLWYRKIDWDKPFSEEVLQESKSATKDLKFIKDINIPRCSITEDNLKIKLTHELHVFTDASMQAYAAVAYLRSSSNTQTTTKIVIGKGRLVEKEQQSNLQIPKLELLGVLIGSRLIRTYLRHTSLEIEKVFLWTDSQIVIHWCCSDKLLPPFVARRVDEIRRVKDIIIRYVPTQLNPADVATRPTASNDNVRRWLQGPAYLKKDSNQWPVHQNLLTDNALTLNSCDGQDPSEITDKVDKTQNKDFEMDMAKTGVIIDLEKCMNEEENNFHDKLKQIQTECYKKEMNGEKTSLGISLGVYKDGEGLLRCGGRLSNTEWPYNQKHPILLPRNHEITSKIIEDTHQKNYHVGVSHTLSLVRKNYWIPSGRSQVQKVIHRCQPCRKYSGGPFKLPPMAQLPTERVTYSHPFTYIGLDYFGPITVNTNGSSEKRWVCLYTCLAVRAIHMEVVSDMTAEECLLAIRRFVSIRSVPKLIVSDNASQFKLTAEVLTSDYCISNNIQWKFIPELAPWFGGFYERIIGIVKNCLKRTVDKHLLNSSQLSTVIKEVEAVVNSRPLTVVDGELHHVLTPADFLRNGGPSLLEESEKEFLETTTITKFDLVDGWKRGQRILREFIDMFSNQYLASLRDRKVFHKQPRVTVNYIPQVGQLVQIKGNSNRTLWKVGRISSVVKSKDGSIRVAKVTIAPNEILTRSVAHLYPLEIPESKDNPPISSTTHSTKDDTQVTNNESNCVDNPTLPELEDQPKTDGSLSKISEPQLSTDNGVAQSADQLRPKRLSAQKAREKVREWTAILSCYDQQH